MDENLMKKFIEKVLVIEVEKNLSLDKVEDNPSLRKWRTISLLKKLKAIILLIQLKSIRHVFVIMKTTTGNAYC
jgi:hypothetical protein